MNDIRLATPADLDDLLGLVRQYWQFEGIAGFDPARVGRVLRQPLLDPKLGRAWVALANGKPVGYLLVVFVFSLEQGGLTAEIDEIFVAPEHRDRALGARLLETAEEGCRNAGCASIALQLGRGNESARRFYLRKGYSERVYDLLDKELA